MDIALEAVRGARTKELGWSSSCGDFPRQRVRARACRQGNEPRVTNEHSNRVGRTQFRRPRCSRAVAKPPKQCKDIEATSCGLGDIDSEGQDAYDTLAKTTLDMTRADYHLKLRHIHRFVVQQ